MAKLSAEKRKELQKLAARPDREIDLSDIPEIREIPPDAVIGRFYGPEVTSRLSPGFGGRKLKRNGPYPRLGLARRTHLCCTEIVLCVAGRTPGEKGNRIPFSAHRGRRHLIRHWGRGRAQNRAQYL